MRLDIFTKQRDPATNENQWALYAASITLANTRRIVAALEQDGLFVGCFVAGGSVGLNKYLTGMGWTSKRLDSKESQ